MAFSIGVLIDESLGQHDGKNYLNERKCSGARSLLILQWLVIGFLITISYKSVLRANMMITEYDDTIDSIDDMLQSERQFMVGQDTPLKYLVENDPRSKVKALVAKNLRYYVQGIMEPAWLREG